MSDEIDLTKFCDPQRPVVASPFSAGFYTYATNGYIAVRVARRDGVNDIPGTADAIERRLVHWYGAMSPFPAASEIAVIIPPCPVCSGVGGRFSLECDECDGTGTVTCGECGHDRDCDKCIDGVKETRPASPDDAAEHVEDCGECNGSGKKDDIEWASVGPYWIDWKWVQLMTALPDLEIDLGNTGLFQTNDNITVRFRFRGGDGCVVPLRGEPPADATPTPAQRTEPTPIPEPTP